MTAAPASPPHALLRRVIVDLAAMTAIGVFLALIGPFGTIAASFSERLVTWLSFAWLGYACYRPMQVVVRWGERALALPRWGMVAAACLVATVPMTVAVMAINRLPSGRFAWPGLDEAMATYFAVLVIGGAVTVLFNLVQAPERGPAPAASAPPAPATLPEPAAAPAPSTPPPAPAGPLLAQLPAELGSDIVALEMEDHYVRVHTALGSALVLMRLRDAMVLLGEIEGMQVHRSWWVARAAVEDVVRDGRNLRLRLARGIEAPVARAKIAALRDARWI